ncbi:hypothetical protein ABZW11_34680 [Nonomuraea sp. NPDC004580]
MSLLRARPQPGVPGLRGVRLNPPKDAELVLEAHDSVIVPAES